MFEAGLGSIPLSSDTLSLLHHADTNTEPTLFQATRYQLMKERIRNMMGVLFLAWTADAALVINQDVKQPQPLNKSSIQYISYKQDTKLTKDNIPKPDAPIQDIIDSLDTDEKYQLFVQTNHSPIVPKTPWTFLKTLAYSPTEFQANGWKAPCNGPSEFACEVGARHGKNMYQLVLWPGTGKKLSDVSSLDDLKHENSWHIVSFYKRYDAQTEEHQYVIFDNSNLVVLNPGESLASWIEKEHFSLPQPLGGITKWKRVPQDLRAKFARYARRTLDEDEIEITPISKPATISIIAQN